MLEHGRNLTPSELTSSPVVSPAKTSHTPEKAQGSQESEAGCSMKQCESFARWDQDSLSWRTSQRCLLEGWVMFSEPWPRSGTMQNGIAYRLPPLVRHTDETACLLFPTPKASDSERGGRGELLALVRGKKTRQMWPTMTVVSAEHPGRVKKKQGQQTCLSMEVHSRQGTTSGALNPQWVEWLMGFPLGWTDCEGSATQ